MAHNPIYNDIVVGRTQANPVYARRGTFNKPNQHLYPTERNKLTHELEAPYAHSLSNGVRYWTRDDALHDVRWNAVAETPCLNCLISDRPLLARRCDRYWRQEASQGIWRCCSHCEESGQAQSCVELIELHTTHLFESLPPPTKVVILETLLRFTVKLDGIEDFGIWGRTASQQRARGLATWRPINLSFGDCEAKAQIVAAHETKGDHRSFSLEPLTYHGRPPCRWRLEYARGLVKVWDRIDQHQADLQSLRKGASETNSMQPCLPHQAQNLEHEHGEDSDGHAQLRWKICGKVTDR